MTKTTIKKGRLAIAENILGIPLSSLAFIVMALPDH